MKLRPAFFARVYRGDLAGSCVGCRETGRKIAASGEKKSDVWQLLFELLAYRRLEGLVSRLQSIESLVVSLAESGRCGKGEL